MRERRGWLCAGRVCDVVKLLQRKSNNMRVSPFFVGLTLRLGLSAAGVINSGELDELFSKVRNSPGRLGSGVRFGRVNVRESSPSLFKALNGSPVPSNFQVVRQHKVKNVTVLSGLLMDENDEVIGDAVVARRTGDDWALVASHANEIESVKIQGRSSSGSELEYDVSPRHNDSQDNDQEFLEEEWSDTHTYTDRTFQSLGRPADWKEGAEMDAAGNIVIDVLCAIHSIAMRDAGNDADGTCTAMLESLNLALVLSGIDNVRFRVVAAMQEDPANFTGQVSPNGDFLNAVRNHFAPKRAAFGADHVVYLTNGREGLAQRPGWLAVGGVRALSVMRHEIGHNMNISHCPTDNSAFYGHLVPETGRGTIMCGNHMPIFASKSLTDMGHPAGRTQDGGPWTESADSNAVNAWIQNAAAHSAFMPRRFPFEEEERVEILPERLVLWHSGEGMDQEVSFVTPPGVKSLMIMAVASTDYPQGAPELYVTKMAPQLIGTAPKVWDYRASKHWKSGANFIRIQEPVANQKYHVVIDDVIKKVPTTGYLLTVWAFQIPYVTTTTTVELVDSDSTTTTTRSATSATKDPAPTPEASLTLASIPLSTPVTSGESDYPNIATSSTTTRPVLTTTSTATKVGLRTTVELMTTSEEETQPYRLDSTLYYQTIGLSSRS